MKHGANAIECDSHARSTTFRYFGAVMQKHCFNVRPRDVGAPFKDRSQHALVFAHKEMISLIDIIRLADLHVLKDLIHSHPERPRDAERSRR